MKDLFRNFRKYAALNEDSRSSIMGNLGMSDTVADAVLAFAERGSIDETNAFILLKIYLLSFPYRDSREGKKNARGFIERLAKRGGLNYSLARFWISTMPHGKDGVTSYALMQDNDRPFVKRLRSARTIEDADAAAEARFLEIEEEKNRAELQRMRDTTLLEFPDGWYWRKVLDCDRESNARKMQHCTQHHGSLVSLRDPNHAPHVTMDWYEQGDAILQAKGKQNELPIKKYWPYIFKFIDSMGVQEFDDDMGDEFYDAMLANTSMPKPVLLNIGEDDMFPILADINEFGHVISTEISPRNDEVSLLAKLFLPKELVSGGLTPTTIYFERLAAAREDLIKKLENLGPWDINGIRMDIDAMKVDKDRPRRRDNKFLYARIYIKGETLEAK